jgi:hypothetical protein
MSTQDIVEKYLTEVRLQQAARDLLAVYRARFGEPPRDIVAAIEGVRDDSLLEKWLALVATRSADDVDAALHAT